MPDDAAIITAFLADRHVPCPACGYDLHGASGGVCPECGQRLALNLGSDERETTRLRRAALTIGLTRVVSGVLWLLHQAYNMWQMAVQFGGGSPFRFMNGYGWIANALIPLQIVFGFWIVARARRGATRRLPLGRVVSAIRLVVVWLAISFSIQIGLAITSLLLRL